MILKILFLGHRSFIRNNTQTAVPNMTIKRMFELDVLPCVCFDIHLQK